MEMPQFLVKVLPMERLDGFSFTKIGGYIGEFNLGLATAMQLDPYDEESDCYIAAADLTADVEALFDFTTLFENTASGSFDISYWLNQLTVMQTKVTSQFRTCNLQQQKFLLDGVLSSWPEAIGAISNLGIQTLTGLLSGNAYEWFGWDTPLSTWIITESTLYREVTEKI